MDKTDKIKPFTEFFVNEVSKVLVGEGYKYIKTKEAFEKKYNEHIFRIYIYPTKWSNFISITIKIFYGNKNIKKQLENNGIKHPEDVVCGGELKRIYEKYFNKKFIYEYPWPLVYILNEPINTSVEKFLQYYQDIIKQFFDDCLDPVKVNKIVNEKPDEIGLNPIVRARALVFIYIGKMAGLDENKLKELALIYKNKLEKWDEEAYFYKDFMKIIEIELKGI